MLAHLMNARVEIVRYGDGAEDDLGRPARAVLSRQADVPARLDQLSSVEGESFTADRWRVELPLDTVIDAGDEVIESGRRFTVDGTPNRLTHPFLPALSRIEAHLNYVGRVDP